MCASGSNEHFGHAPQHTSDSHTWGGATPPVGLGAANATRGRGRSRPFLAATPCAGALTGRHKPPPAPQRRRREIEASKQLPRLASAWLTWAGHVGSSSASVRGPTAPWGSVPLLGPLRPRLLERVDDADTVEVVKSWQVFRVERAYISFHARCDDQGIPQRRSSREMELFARVRLPSVGKTRGRGPGTQRGDSTRVSR